MKIIVKIPKAQEQGVLDAFTAYNNLVPADQTENLKQNVLGFVQNVYKGMETARQVTVVVTGGKEVIEQIPPKVGADANKLSVDSTNL